MIYSIEHNCSEREFQEVFDVNKVNRKRFIVDSVYRIGTANIKSM